MKLFFWLRSLFRRRKPKRKKLLKHGRVALTPLDRIDLCKTVEDHEVECRYQQALVIALVRHTGGELRIPLDDLRRVNPTFFDLSITLQDNEYVFRVKEYDSVQFEPRGYDGRAERGR